MITINGVNKWTPAIYKSESPVDWAAERNRTSGHGYKCGSDRKSRNEKQHDVSKA